MKRNITRAHLRRIILQEAAPIIRRAAAAPVAATELLPTEYTYADLTFDAREAHDAPTTKDKAVFMAGYNEGADDAADDKPHKYGEPVEPTPDTAMDDLTLGYSYGYSSFDGDGVDIHPRGSASNLETGDYEIHDASHWMGEGRRAKQLTRAQLRRILQEMYGMSGQDMRDSGRLREELVSNLYGILSGMRMDSNDISMFSGALESALARAHSVIKGEDQDYQVTIAPASQLTRDFASSGMISEAAVTLDPQGIQSMRAQRSFLHDNFEDDPGVYKKRIMMAAEKPEYAALKVALPLIKLDELGLEQISEFIIASELDHGMAGLIDYVLGVDV